MNVRTSPQALVVNPKGEGYSTITEAIQAAPPGSTISIYPGTYLEPLVLTKPLTLVGEGELGQVVVAIANSDVLSFQTESGRVVNLTLQQRGGGKWCAVDITQGCLELEHCDISSQGSACVMIHNGAAPHLFQNRIHDSAANGIFVCDGGQGNIEENDIFANTLAGVEIKTLANPRLINNCIYGGDGFGVLIFADGLGYLEGNDIFSNTLAGIAIKTGGNPTLCRNRIRGGDASGVFIYEGGRGLLEHNEIYANVLAGVEIRTGGAPTLKHNRIYHNGCEAIRVRGGSGIIEDNDLRHNTLGSWSIALENQSYLQCDRNLEED